MTQPQDDKLTERVARAMFAFSKTEAPDIAEQSFEDMMVDEQEFARRLARAAISAMHAPVEDLIPQLQQSPVDEPTEAMIRAGVSMLHGTAKDSDTYTVEQIYRAMRAATPSEQPPASDGMVDAVEAAYREGWRVNAIPADDPATDPEYLEACEDGDWLTSQTRADLARRTYRAMRAATPTEQPPASDGMVADSDSLVTGLGQVRYVLRSVANGDNQSEAAPKAIEIVDAALAALTKEQSNAPRT